MKIKLKEITIRKLTTEYQNNDQDGVTGFNNKLDIRPKYQREYIYNPKQRNAVIDTIRKDFPLNVMYWVKKDNDSYEVLDGQQRTISICEYVAGNFSLDFHDINTPQQFHNLEPIEQDQILDYKLMVYFCEGSTKEKLDWFKTINIAGVKLSDQELRNAVYSGSWLTHAKERFSKTGCIAYKIGHEYLKGVAIRQEYLETALKWISNNNIEHYMSLHQHDKNANELWLYFENVINWVKATFPNYRKEMKGINFGSLYNEFKEQFLDIDNLEIEIKTLMQDDDVTKKSGIFIYILTRNVKHLSIRTFTSNQIRITYEQQDGICTACGDHFDITEMEADHIDPWSKGGKTILDNCQMLCVGCNRRKSNV